jgi:histidinol-phosphate aminotransferase
MKYWNKTLKDMTEYVPGEQPSDSESYIKLNTNENPFPPSPKALEMMKNACNANLRLYPSPVSKKLIQIAAKKFNLAEDNIFAANGSDELFTLIFRAFINKDEKAAFNYPSYSLYYTMSEANGISYDKIRLDSKFQIQYSEFLKEKYKLVIFCNPNNPTGTDIDKDELIQFLRKFKGLVVIDEAYVDFSGNSMIDLVNEYDNIIITRTFSKSYSLAGLRVGIAIAHKDIIKGFYKIKDSYNVDTIAQTGAAAALEDDKQLKYNIEMVLNNRDYLQEMLDSLGFISVPSVANFIFTRHPDFDSEKLYKELKKRKILIRFFKGEIQSEYIRISVGTMMEIKKLINNIREIIET